MSKIYLVIYCPDCHEEIEKPLRKIVEPQGDIFVGVGRFAQTTWDCSCGESFSIGDIDIVNVKNL